VEIASKEGASGFLAGRAVWKDFTKYFPNESDMAAWLKTSGVANYYKLYEASKKAVPFYEHQQFVSFAGISIKDAGEDWYKTF
ncbi:MAG: hypothetical protein U9Q18_01475, partial [Caldisericota bacterium]|nr:hypothetical protein [Caldisericota bacterium]